MEFFKKYFGNLVLHRGISIQVKIFGILFAFLIAQSLIQLYLNIEQGNNALSQITKSLDESLETLTESQGKRLDQINSAQKEEMHVMSRLIIGSINDMMMTGNADIVKEWFEEVANEEMFLKLQLFRTWNHPGEVSFRDNETIKTVNYVLENSTFRERMIEEKEVIEDSLMDEFNKAMESGTPRFIEQDMGSVPAFTGLFVLPNTEECQSCHGEDHKTRGILRVTISAKNVKMAENDIRKQMEDAKVLQEKEVSEVKGESRTARNISIIAAIVLITINLLVLNSFFRVMVVKPVNDISIIAGKIAGGDLRTEIKMDRDDEIGDLYKSLSEMKENLKRMINQIHKSSMDVSSAASNLNSFALHINEGTTKQTEQSTHAATSVEEMSSTITEIARSSSEALGSSTMARETAERGAKAVQETVEGIHRVFKAMEKSSAMIKTLGENSNEINKIISVIDEIAEQTNLLALNAAIEAARAGEAGRGFAVVADEVRKLAERTTKATKEIAGMIQKIQNDTIEAVGSMDEVMTEVKQDVSLADETGRSLSEIVKKVEISTDMVNHIATASEEQSKTVEEIARNVNEVAQVSIETSKDSKETLVAAQKLSVLADDLSKLVSQFKI
ncbi:MAG: methyl-accepting chemotaxis protein [Nitrospinota bacterium]|nr:methyl-accepting chemotaxis protein [Nitrospinota bacterium]